VLGPLLIVFDESAAKELFLRDDRVDAAIAKALASKAASGVGGDDEDDDDDDDDDGGGGGNSAGSAGKRPRL
jgi:hypothetical protein